MNLLPLPALTRGARSAAVGLSLVAACGLTAASTSYELMRFADPRGAGPNFFPTGINNAFVVAGTASFLAGFSLSGINDTQPGATITVFDVPGINNNTRADDINNHDVIVGSYNDGTGQHGFIRNNGVFSTVDVPGAAFATRLTGINDAGDLVGQYRQAGTGNFLGFVKSGSNFVVLNAAQSLPNTFAQGINNAGRVVGSVGDAGATSRGFTFEAGVFEFFDAPGASWTQAYGINNAGQIVGGASTGLFVKDGNTFTYLDLPASWRAVQAFATDITDDGVVVGHFKDGFTNVTYGFLATPVAEVPEPASALMLLAGALALAASRRSARASG